MTLGHRYAITQLQQIVMHKPQRHWWLIVDKFYFQRMAMSRHFTRDAQTFFQRAKNDYWNTERAVLAVLWARVLSKIMHSNLRGQTLLFKLFIYDTACIITLVLCTSRKVIMTTLWSTLQKRSRLNWKRLVRVILIRPSHTITSDLCTRRRVIMTTL